MLLGACAGCAPEGQVPTVELAPRPFATRIVAEGVLRAARSTPITTPGQHGPVTIAWILEDGTAVREGDLIVRLDASVMERELLEGELARDTAARKIEQRSEQSRATLEQVERDFRLAELELDFGRSFSSKDPEIFSRHEILESRIDERLARGKREHAETRGELERALAGSDTRLLDIERSKAERQAERAREDLAALEVRAPHDGIVLLRRDRDGEVVQAGAVTYGRHPIAELPALDEMEAEVFVLEADAGGLVAGLPATLVVEGRPDRTFEGAVASVDRIPKPRLRGVPLQFFSVTVRLSETDPGVMKPGQRVRATLTVEQRNEAIVVPRSAVLEEDGRTIVYRLDGGVFEAVDVELGPSSLGDIVVETGLEAGDVVAIRDPTRTVHEIVPGRTVETREEPTS